MKKFIDFLKAAFAKIKEFFTSESFIKGVLFFASFLFLIGALGSIGYLAANHAWVILAGQVLVIGCAIPTIAKWVKRILE